MITSALVQALGRVPADLDIKPPTDANDSVVQTAINTGSPIFGFIQTIFVFIGIAIVVFTLFKVVKAFAKGSFGESVKVGVGGLLAAVLCFNLWLPIGLVNQMGDLVGSVFDTVGETADNVTPSGPDAPVAPAADPAAPAAPAG